jgi:hypothetical protein
MKASDWIKVEDRLPEERQLCLVRDKRGRYMCGVYQEIEFLHDNSKQWGISNGTFYTLLKGIAHWLPIVPPKED